MCALPIPLRTTYILLAYRLSDENICFFFIEQMILHSVFLQIIVFKDFPSLVQLSDLVGIQV